MSVNFVVLWALPILGMGAGYKHALKIVVKPLYDWLDNSVVLRYLAENYIYTNTQHSDFFAMSVLLLLNWSVSIGIVFYWQLNYGSLPWWLIALYYCSWVGTGGTMMGAAYGLAHKEVFMNIIVP